MVKHNNVVPNGHFKKHWQNYVRTWFNQPARKTRRLIAREKTVVKIFSRPTAGPLRPIVHGQTLKYNMKLRAGRGFSLEEFKAAGIPKKLAPTIGIAFDHRRRNRSLEGLQANVQRQKTYKAKLVVFPKRARKFKMASSGASSNFSTSLLCDCGRIPRIFTSTTEANPGRKFFRCNKCDHFKWCEPLLLLENIQYLEGKYQDLVRAHELEKKIFELEMEKKNQEAEKTTLEVKQKIEEMQAKYRGLETNIQEEKRKNRY